jgi:hypothetical protein
LKLEKHGSNDLKIEDVICIEKVFSRLQLGILRIFGSSKTCCHFDVAFVSNHKVITNEEVVVPLQVE